jgi:lauroyl/myristoyl acyltransferase
MRCDLLKCPLGITRHDRITCGGNCDPRAMGLVRRRFGLLRTLRKWLTARITDASVSLAPSLREQTVDRIEPLIARLGPALPIVSSVVAANMRAAGVYSPAAHRQYFHHLGGHFTGAVHALRCGSNGSDSTDLARIAAERVSLDASVERLRAAAEQGRGVILMGPHICNYLLSLTRLNQDVPLTIYLRYSKDARRRGAKQRWYRASGVEWISEPPDRGGAMGRLGRMAAALREGKVLFITPDLARIREEGTPVRLFDREVYLPPGPAVLAVRTGAPLFTLSARQEGRRQRLQVTGPYASPQGVRPRRAEVLARLQWFADEFAAFVREDPPLWYLWGDKRWSRVFRDDPRYVRSAD